MCLAYSKMSYSKVSDTGANVLDAHVVGEEGLRYFVARRGEPHT